ncbi:MAG: hypothetical protein ACRCVW_02310 [Brevinema sp.]
MSLENFLEKYSLLRSDRFYIDSNGQQYIKKLTLIDDSIYSITYSEKSYPLCASIKPYARQYEIGDGSPSTDEVIRYYNDKQDFYRILFSYDENKKGILVQTCSG